MSRVMLSFGPFKIYWYSALILLGVIIGISLANKEAKREGMSSYISDLIISLIFWGIVGSRLYFVIFNFSEYQDNFLDIFKIWEGGLAIYGAVIAGFLTILYYAKKREQSVIKTTDIIVPSLILAQAIGRWGNFFNAEAHGTEVSLKFLQNLHLPQFIIEGMHINGVYFQPTFLYESLWCFLGFILLIVLRKIKGRTKGLMTYTYFIWYGIGRFFIEGMRTDSLYIGTYRVSQLVSIALVLIGVVGLIIKKVKGRNV